MINEIFKRIEKSTFAANGDCYDKMAAMYTSIFYALGSLFLAISPFVAGPFICQPPAHFKVGTWGNYINRFCFLKNSFYIPPDQMIKEHVESGNAHEITYYQWVPYYLAFSSVFFIIPYVYWTSITEMAGINLEYLITKAAAFDVKMSKVQRKSTIYDLAKCIDMYLDNQEQIPGGKSICEKIVDLFKCCSNQKGTLMGNNYFFTKLMYIALIVFQMVSLCYFLGFNVFWYALNPSTIGQRISHHSFDWQDSEQFPLVTFCNFSKQVQFENYENVFIQCSMPNNIYIERYFIFLSYWLVFLLGLMIYSAVSWFNAIFLSTRRQHYVKTLFRVTSEFPAPASDNPDPEALSEGMQVDRLQDFVSWYLHADGIFVFQMIENNTSPVVASEILWELWDHFNVHYEEETKHRRQKKPRKGGKKGKKDAEDEEGSALDLDDSPTSSNDKPRGRLEMDA